MYLDAYLYLNNNEIWLQGTQSDLYHVQIINVQVTATCVHRMSRHFLPPRKHLTRGSSIQAKHDKSDDKPAKEIRASSFNEAINWVPVLGVGKKLLILWLNIMYSGGGWYKCALLCWPPSHHQPGSRGQGKEKTVTVKRFLRSVLLLPRTVVSP